jgi:hypothetical protein
MSLYIRCTYRQQREEIEKERVETERRYGEGEGNRCCT